MSRWMQVTRAALLSFILVTRRSALSAFRSRLQWAAEDWPQLGRPDSRGGVLGGQVMMRLDLLNPFQVNIGLHDCT